MSCDGVQRAAGEASQESYTHLNSSSSTTTAYTVLIIILIYYLLRARDSRSPFLQRPWRMLVAATPNRLVAALDGGFGSHLAKTEAAQTQEWTVASRKTFHHEKSLALKRILHFETGPLALTSQVKSTASTLGDIVKRACPPSIPGLGNWDNSCYQNSVLQALASLESLPPFLDSDGGENTETTKAALKELVRQLNEGRTSAGTLWTPSKLKNMSSWQQQDAQEYFSKVQDEMDKETSKAYKSVGRPNGLQIPRQAMSYAGDAICKSQARGCLTQIPDESSSSSFQNPMEGFLAQRVGCQSCGYVEGLTLVPFTCLTLPLGNERVYDIRDRLDEFTTLESISGVECVRCTLLNAKKQMQTMLQASAPDKDPKDSLPETTAFRNLVQERLAKLDKALDDGEFTESVLKECQIRNEHRVSSTKTRQAVIARAPRSLVLHVNRSVFNELTGAQSKNYAKVQFPLTLSLGAWCLGASAAANEKESPTEQWLLEPSVSMLVGAIPADEHAAEPHYRLRAAITHFGRHENGHYVCYRQSPESWKAMSKDDSETSDETNWWRLSDQQVTQVTQEELLDQGGIFMLFYEQVPSAKDSPETEIEEAPMRSAETSNASHDASKKDESCALVEADSQEVSDTSTVETPIASASTAPDLMGTPENSSPTVVEHVKRATTPSQVNAQTPALKQNTLPTPPSTPEPFVHKQSFPKLSPRSGRDHADSAAQVMESMAGYVQAS